MTDYMHYYYISYNVAKRKIRSPVTTAGASRSIFSEAGMNGGSGTEYRTVALNFSPHVYSYTSVAGTTRLVTPAGNTTYNHIYMLLTGQGDEPPPPTELNQAA